MAENDNKALSDQVETVQSATENSSRLGRIRQKLGHRTPLQVTVSSLLEAEASNTGKTEQIAYKPGLESAVEEELIHLTPEEQALLLGNVVHEEHKGGGQYYVELDNGEAGIYWESVSPKFRNTRGAYVVDRAWNFGLVPTTVMRFDRDAYGEEYKLSFQKYIPNAKDARNIPDFENDERFQTDLYKLWILQYSIWYADAHKGNVIVADQMYAIDFAHAFWHDKDRESHRHMFKEFYGVRAPAEVVDEASSFLQDDIRQQVLLEELRKLHFYEEDIEACLARMRHVATTLTAKGQIDNPEELEEYDPNSTVK